MTLFLMIGVASPGEASVRFRIDSPSLDLLEADNETDRYNRLEVFVNGVLINKTDKWFKVNCVEEGLDQIVVVNEDTMGDRDTILAKLRNKQSYRFEFNTCSFYEIVPGRGKGGSHGYIRIISEERDSTDWFFITDMAWVNDSLIRSQDTTKYFEVFSSAYCPYTPTGFYICNVDVDNEPTIIDDEFCVGKVIWFTGTEKYSFIYNYKKRIVEVVFDGYYKYSKK